MSQDTKICLCVFASSHGVRGDIKVKAFTEDPRDIVAYGPLQNQDGTREFNLKVIRVLNNNVVLVSCPEIANREEAQTLSGMKLFIDRDKLTVPENKRPNFTASLDIIFIERTEVLLSGFRVI